MTKSSANRAKGRDRPKSQRLVLVEEWHPSEKELSDVMSLVRRSGVVEPIHTHLDRRRDAEKRLSTFGFLVALLLNGSRMNHKGAHIDIAKILNGLGPASLRRLGMPDWRLKGSYDRAHRLHTTISRALDERWEHTDARSGVVTCCNWTWYFARTSRSPFPDNLLEAMKNNVGLAIDGTDMESCGQLEYGDPSSIEYDGEDPESDESETFQTDESGKKKSRTKKGRPPKVLAIGEDGRRIYTKDSEARGGHRTGNSSRPAGRYTGRELHLGVAVPALEKTDGVRWTKFAREVPQVVLSAALVPAGTHKGSTACEMVLAAHAEGLCRDVTVDRGYTQSVPKRFHIPLQRAGIPVTMMLKSNQRGEKPGIGSARYIDGALFAEQVNDEDVDLPWWPQGASETVRAPYVAKFNRRAAYRYGRHMAPGEDGVTRWNHPVKAGTLRSRSVPKSVRRPISVPRIEVEADADLATIRAGADALPLWQPCLLGTTAWCNAYGRRQLTETVNSFLHGAAGSITDIGRHFTKIMNSGRIKLFVANTVAGYNRLAIRRWFTEREPSGAHTSSRPRLRKPRSNRVRRYEDIPGLAGTGPPDSPFAA